MTVQVDAQATVLAFHHARSSGNVDEASSYLAPDFAFESPLMRFDSPAEYLARHHAFQSLVTGLEMISELYAESEATWIYDLNTATPAGVQRTAEHFRLNGGKISTILLIFDAAPWIPLMSSLTSRAE